MIFLYLLSMNTFVSGNDTPVSSPLRCDYPICVGSSLCGLIGCCCLFNNNRYSNNLLTSKIRYCNDPAFLLF